MNGVIWFDALTPKHLRLASHVRSLAEKRGYGFLLTSRQYDEIPGMARILGLNPLYVGKHGGADLSSKLLESSRRTVQLAETVSGKDLIAMVSHASPEATRVAFGLGLKTVNVNDSPHAEAVARLTVPLSDKLITTSFIPSSAWKKFGPKNNSLVRYRGLEVVEWLKDYRPKPIPYTKDWKEPVVLFRPEEVKASYVTGSSQGSRYSQILRDSLKLLKFTLVVLPR
ncbi:MAG: DUF354 domain-containing protein, partial [Thermoprotei archaeon]